MQRRLTVILSADVAGYGALMQRDEPGTLARLKAAWAHAFAAPLAAHEGRVVKTMGDGALIEFASVVSAIACALGVRHPIRCATRRASKPRSPPSKPATPKRDHPFPDWPIGQARDP
ncbi:MAG: hypothetical protein ABUS48_01740 [Pseudomonadota bacterium]